MTSLERAERWWLTTNFAYRAEALRSLTSLLDAQAAEARREALEEAAAVCHEIGSATAQFDFEERWASRRCADAIRALKDKP